MALRSPNTQPIFIRSPKIWTTTLQTELGDTNPASTLLPKTLAIGGDPASAIDTIEIQPTGDMVATILNIYLFDTVGTQGQNRLISQTDLPEITGFTRSNRLVVLLPATLSPASPESDLPNRMLRLPQGWELRAALSIAIANPIIVTAFGGDYA
jgi:hypothetical protein